MNYWSFWSVILMYVLYSFIHYPFQVKRSCKEWVPRTRKQLYDLSCEVIYDLWPSKGPGACRMTFMLQSCMPLIIRSHMTFIKISELYCGVSHDLWLWCCSMTFFWVTHDLWPLLFNRMLRYEVCHVTVCDLLIIMTVIQWNLSSGDTSITRRKCPFSYRFLDMGKIGHYSEEVSADQRMSSYWSVPWRWVWL